MFARLLIDAKDQQKELLEPEYQIDSRVEKELLPKLAKEHGASDQAGTVRKLSKEIDDKKKALSSAEDALRDLGFSWDDGDLSLTGDAPEVLDQALRKEKRLARAERERSLKKYDQAILAVWAAETADQAKKAVEPLL